MSNIFTAPESTSQQMADHLPNGRAWGKKNIEGSNTRLLINSLAVAHNRAQAQVQYLEEQYKIEQTTTLLEEWEESVGLPSECTSNSYPTTEQRRQSVIETLRRDPIVVLGDTPDTYSGSMQEYVDNALPDQSIILYAGQTYIDANPGAFTDDPKNVLVAEIQTGDLTFEYAFQLGFPFGGGVDQTALACVLNKIIPTNVLLFTTFV